MITIGYKILFTINVLHDYYDDHLSRETVLIPTVETQRILKNYQLLFKSTPNGGLVLARISDSAGTIQIPISTTQKFKLRFYLNATSAYFYNRTNLPINTTNVPTLFPYRRGFYFNNSEKVANNIFPVPGFQKPDGSKKLKHLSNTTNTEVSSTDEIIFIPSIFRVKFDNPTNSFKIKIKDKKNVELILEEEIAETDNFIEYEIKLAKNLPPDFYKIIIEKGNPKNEITQNVFLSNQVFHDKPLGVVEISYSDKLGEFNFLKTQGAGANKKIQVKGAADYFIWFKSRKMRWRYVFQGALPATIEIPSDVSISFTSTANYFESNKDIEIKESYTKIKKDDEISIPNPDGKILKPVYNGTSISYYFAEVYL